MLTYDASFVFQCQQILRCDSRSQKLSTFKSYEGVHVRESMRVYIGAGSETAT